MKTLLLPLVCAVLISCNCQKTATQNETGNLNATWLLKEMNGEPAATTFMESPKTPQLQLNIAEMKVSGNDGCNSMFGAIENWDTTVLTFKNLGGTKMACANMERSSEYSQALSNTKTYKIKNAELHLFDAAGNKVLIFKKQGD